MALSIVLVLLAFAAMIAYEVPRMLREKMRRELWAFFVLIAIGLVLSIGQILKLPLPNVTRGIEAVVRPVYKALEAMLT
ncbi:MAG: hypothetical protein H0Z39_06785 [Peptococcaceae bacterium]|nr:hypothetical protein [Peptococcaceae bacterium]